MTHKEFYFSFFKTKFYGQFFKTKNVKAVIVLVHGMGEHSSRYTKFVIPKLLQNDVSVITYDQFGHGKTEGKRGHNPNYDAVLETVSEVVKKAKQIFGNVPIFLYGHSMGGNVALNYALKKEHNFNGIIASSPLLRLAFQPPKWKLTAGRIMQKIAPSITLPSELQTSHISRIADEVKQYENDPLVHDKISANYSLAFFDAGEWAINNAYKLNTPTLILHGTEDKITDYKASEEFSKNASKKVTLQLFEGGYHELHNDLDQAIFIQKIIDWVIKKLH